MWMQYLIKGFNGEVSGELLDLCRLVAVFACERK